MMKKLLLLALVSVMVIGTYAQPPKKISYQLVVRDAFGKLISDRAVGMRISILSGSPAGTPVYVETHNKITNSNGLITVEIGGGTFVSGAFGGIDWSDNIFYIKTETDPKGGTNYTITGTSQILSVPYALYAAAAPPTTNANAISSGTLNPLYYSAYNDLISEGRLDNTTGADILTRTQADSRYNQKIGFFAFNSDYDQTVGDIHKIEFNQEPFDDGNCFDDSRDRFIAPVTGVYSFSVSVGLSTPGGSGTFGYYVYLYRNGTEYCLLNEITSGVKVTLCGSVTLKLAASDYVEIFVFGYNAKIHGDANGLHNTFFSGHLVYPIY